MGAEVLATRESYPNLTLAKLYDAVTMPVDLQRAHNKVNEYLEQVYSVKQFKDDEERLSTLFQMYSEMTGAQNA